MSQQLEQVEKQITFEELCPKWTEALSTGKTKKGYEDLSSGWAHCIVGEAYGFKDQYAMTTNPHGCLECTKIASLLVPSTVTVEYNGEVKVYDFRLLQNRKDMFIEHWNLCHRVGEK